jgi:hypothetical protein
MTGFAGIASKVRHVFIITGKVYRVFAALLRFVSL